MTCGVRAFTRNDQGGGALRGRLEPPRAPSVSFSSAATRWLNQERVCRGQDDPADAAESKLRP
jgi:hypothetical protein